MEEIRTEEQNILARLNQRLRDKIFPGTKLNSEEETIMNIVYKILNAPGTVKVAPRGTDTYYLVNDGYHYYVRLRGISLIIVNTVDSIERLCTPGFADYLTRVLDQEIKKDADKLDNRLFNRLSALYEKMSDKIV